MLHKIEDESGQAWYVGSGDPAHEAVKKLHTRHYTWIVLPRGLITSGHLVSKHPDWGHKEALRQARRMGYTNIEGRRHLRLAECLHILGGG